MEAVRDPEERERLVYAVRNNSFDRELGQYPEDSKSLCWHTDAYLAHAQLSRRAEKLGHHHKASSVQRHT